VTQRVDKATCLITRRNDGVDEIVVFDHPLAGVQLPAGTGDSGEDPLAAALREGWEEAGIPRLSARAKLNELVEASPGGGHGRLAVDAVVRLEELPAEIGAWWHPGMLGQILAGAGTAWNV
jgi:8-oxo-dGTP pyrophosphatase MutT (NUDIX family)